MKNEIIFAIIGTVLIFLSVFLRPDLEEPDRITVNHPEKVIKAEKHKTTHRSKMKW